MPPMLDDAVTVRMPRTPGVEGGHQRRTLAAGGDVAAAEVGDHRDAGEFGKQRGIADLQGVAVLRAVSHGLAVAADRADLFGRRSRREASSPLPHNPRQLVGGQRGAMEFVVPGSFSPSSVRAQTAA